MSSSIYHAKYNSRSGAFVDNISLPIHRWYRYSAGFSADWVRHVLRERKKILGDFTVLDPFAGVATTLLACNAEQIKCFGFETHPFIYRVAKTKLSAIHLDVENLRLYFQDFLKNASLAEKADLEKEAPLLRKCYSDSALLKLIAFRDTFQKDFATGTVESEILWLLITSILRTCSFAGTAQWQYIMPRKKKSKTVDPFIAFQNKAREVLEDIIHVNQNKWLNASKIILKDARSPENVEKIQVKIVITSPPYPNNYDYADATRLEMTFWREIMGWGDLQNSVRRYLIRSCSQHAAAERLSLDEILKADVLRPIYDDLSSACYKLAEIRMTKSGRKTYHTMAAAYFKDLAEVFIALRSLCQIDSELCFVIGDSAPYGIYLDVDTWIGDLALAAGFKSYKFEKIRDRNIKWKNRKHRVPLKEGRLWIKG